VELDRTVRRHLYDVARDSGRPPLITELAHLASVAEQDIRASLERLANGRILVRQPGSGEILMLPPFSAVPTPFVVETSSHSSYANCAWDAFGVPIMLGERGRVITACGCCGERIVLEVTPERPPDLDHAMHFAVPAARWWQDMVFT
jgi:Alkylmercury lyase